MRVLFVNENIGGHATVHRHIEQELRSHPSIDAEFLHMPGPGIARRAVGATVPGLGRLDLDLGPLRAQLALGWATRRALRTRVAGFDVVHFYTQNAALLSGHFLRTHPSVVSTDSTNALNAYRLPYRKPTIWTPRVLRLTQRFERRVYDAATLVIANSQYVAQSLQSDYGLVSDRLRPLAMGIPVPDAPPRRAPSDTLPVIAFVGWKLERKGGLRLLRLHQQHLAQRCELALVTGEHVEPRPNVVVHNDVTVGNGRLAGILARSSIFVFPSEIDQAPNAVLEAMASGLPVVALKVGALSEMVEDGVTGFLVDPGDDGALLRAITTLLDDNDLRARMGAAAHERALQRYDIRHCVRRLVEILVEAKEHFDHEQHSR